MIAMKRSSALLSLIAALTLATAASAESRVSIEGPTVRVSDIDPEAPAELADIDLGRAPPPGSSRVLTGSEIKRRVRDAGEDPARMNVPASVRVETPAEHWKPEEVAVRSDAAVRASLPLGVSLVKLDAQHSIVVPPGSSVTSVKPVIPHVVGRHDVTVVAEVRRNQEIVARAPLTLVVDVGEDAFAPILHKGDRITLIIEQGNTRIGAAAVTLADANPGDAIFCRVSSTGKVLKAKVQSRDVGKVVEL
jgi:hypothetical protein